MHAAVGKKRRETKRSQSHIKCRGEWSDGKRGSAGCSQQKMAKHVLWINGDRGWFGQENLAFGVPPPHHPIQSAPSRAVKVVEPAGFSDLCLRFFQQFSLPPSWSCKHVFLVQVESQSWPGKNCKDIRIWSHHTHQSVDNRSLAKSYCSWPQKILQGYYDGFSLGWFRCK